MIPINPVENTWCSVSYARLLFQNSPTHFHIVGIIEGAINSKGAQLRPTDSAEGNKVIMEQLLMRFIHNNRNADHKFTLGTTPTTLPEEMNKILIAEKIDAIIMQTKWTMAIHDVFMGRFVLNVLKKVKGVPILVVPKEYTFRKPTCILFSTNFKRAFKRRELGLFIELAKIWKSKIVVAQFEPDEQMSEFQRINKSLLKDIFYGSPITFEILGKQKEEALSLSQFAKTTNPDLTAIVNHRYNFFQKLIQGDVVKKIAFESECPLLILPELV